MKKHKVYWERFKRALRVKGGEVTDLVGQKQDAILEPDDPIYHKKIHPDPEPDKGVLTRGGIDVWFFLIVLGLILYGVIMAYSASSIYAAQYHDDSTYFIKKHVMYLAIAVIGTVPFVFMARLWFWKLFAIGAYGGSVVLLLAVLVMGTVFGGANRWIALGPITIQSSEIAKMALIMFLALFMSKYQKQINTVQKFGGHFTYGVIGPVVIIGIICGLVMLEKHLSGLIILGMLGIVVMFLGGTKLKWFAFIGVGGVSVVSGVLLFSDYARKRIDTWINIDKVDPLGEAWQTLQGLYAIGSGGFFGRGLGNSQQKYGYVSQPQNDFIFTIVCEELGMLGVIILMGLVVLLVWRGYKIAANAPDKFCALTVYGLTTKVALQTILNIAVVTNSMPNTGISLPFFSSGGTALALQIFEMGIILSISRYSYQKK
ncbi:MAG: cell division protein FtsW [Clostridia bacterium]|nr:cell division protein FtsW [Clostridia bacterium]